MLRRALLLTIILLLAGLGGGAVWLVSTESGLQTSVQLAS